MIYQNHIYVIHLVEKTFLLPFMFIFTAALNYCLGYYLVSYHGIVGAGIARCATMTVMAAIITVWARRYIKFTLPWMPICKTTLAALLMGIIVYYLPSQTWIELICATVCGIVIYVLFLIIFRIITIEKIVKLMHSLRA